MIPGDRLPTLRADRIVLRWIEESDLDALYQVFAHPDVTRYWSTPPFERPEEAELLLHDIRTRFAQRELFQWGIARAEDDVLIGTVTLHRMDLSNRRAEVGFALAREAWGHGLMREALTTLIAFAFDDLRMHRLEADVDPDNDASLGLLERLGFQREGYLRERWIVAGAIRDTVLLGLLEREWRERMAGRVPRSTPGDGK